MNAKKENIKKITRMKIIIKLLKTNRRRKTLKSVKKNFDFKETVRKQLTSQLKLWKLVNNGNHIQIAE